jgi:hypothetical protein
MVKLREDSDEWVVELMTERHARACPLPWDDAVPQQTKDKKCFRYEPADGGFIQESVQEYLDGPGHLMSSFLVVGEGGVGKSRMLHAMATEVVVGCEGRSTYLFGKSLDALGILSFAGVVRRSGCVVVVDADLRVARGAPLSHESFKSLFDVDEGGALQDTRYRPAQFPPNLTRLFAFNGSGEVLGAFLRGVGQFAIADVAEALLVTGAEAAAVCAARCSADEKAILRRMTWCLCAPGEVLVHEQLRERLAADTAARAAAARARRSAFWAQQRSVA